MNTLFRDLSIIWSLAHCVIMFMFLYESKYSKKVTNIATFIAMLVLVPVNMINILFFGVTKAAQLIILTCIIPSFLFFFIMAKNKDFRFIFTFCFVDTIIYEVLIITNMLDSALGLGNYIFMFVSRLIIFPVLEYFIIKYIRDPYHQFQNKIKKGWGLFSLMTAIFYILMIVSTSFPTIMMERPEDYPLIILIITLLPVMYITVFRLLWSQMSLYETKEENQVLIMQMNMTAERIASTEEIEKQLKIQRHDIKHHMILLSGYLENGEIERANKYIKGITENADKSHIYTYSKNNSVNMILSHYVQKAKNKGLTLNPEINLPQTLHFSETDFAVILSNGIENAINALTESDCDKHIIIKAFIKNDKLYLEIKNRFADNIIFEDGLPKTSKDGHGYGTKSMAMLVERNNGIFSFVVENGDFIFRCTI